MDFYLLTGWSDMLDMAWCIQLPGYRLCWWESTIMGWSLWGLYKNLWWAWCCDSVPFCMCQPQFHRFSFNWWNCQSFWDCRVSVNKLAFLCLNLFWVFWGIKVFYLQRNCLLPIYTLWLLNLWHFIIHIVVFFLYKVSF